MVIFTDRFTSSREGVLKSDPLYEEFLNSLKKVQAHILDEWDKFRIEIIVKTGDKENTSRLSKYKRELRTSQISRSEDYEEEIKNNKNIDEEYKGDFSKKIKRVINE